MGMLFNTPDTLSWVAKVHTAFYNAWPTFQKSPSVYAPLFRSLGANGASSYSVLKAKPLNLIHPSKNARWTKWLDMIDQKGWSPTIGGWIADAIENTSFVGVEFHPVAAHSVYATYVDFPNNDPAAPNTFTKNIEINTLTWDGVG